MNERDPRRRSKDITDVIKGSTRHGLLEKVSQELGVPPAELVKRIARKQEHVHDLTANTKGKFRVVGVDRFDGSDWVAGEFNSAREAFITAQKKTREARKLASDPSIATVFYPYTPDGRYIDRTTSRKRKKKNKV